MAYNQITITERFAGTTPNPVSSSRRLSTPIVVQPTYVVDVSYLNGIFVKEASLGTDFSWNGGILEIIGGVNSLDALIDVSINALMNNEFLVFDNSLNKWTNKVFLDASISSAFTMDISILTWDIRTFFYTKPEIDSLLNAVVGGTY